MATCKIMEFLGKILRNNQMTVPKNVVNYMNLHAGDMVHVNITVASNEPHVKNREEYMNDARQLPTPEGCGPVP